MDRDRELETFSSFDYLTHLGLAMRAGGRDEQVKLSRYVNDLEPDLLRRLLMIAMSFHCTALERRQNAADG